MIRLSILIFCLFTGLVSCTKSTENITSSSGIKASIDIYQSLSDQNENTVSITLYDKNDKEIGNDSISIYVNQKKTNYTVHQNLYYTKNYFYRIENISPEKNRYEVEILLTNGKKFSLGSVDALRISSANTIICPEEASLDNDLFIEWSNLYDVDHLILSKSIELVSKKEPNVDYFSEEAGDTLKINPTGNYVMKKETFSKPNEKLSILVFTFQANKTGTMNRELLPGSNIMISGNHEKEVHFK